MLTMMKDKQFCDVVLNVNGREFEAHKIILASRSPVFNAMFTSKMKENSKNIVDIEDISEDVFEELLSYIYTGEVNKLNHLAGELIFAADKYQIEDLKIICEHKLITMISIQNCIHLLQVSDAHSLYQLEQKLIPFIKENINKIEESVFDDLSKSHPNLLLKLFKKLVYNKSTKTKMKMIL